MGASLIGITSVLALRETARQPLLGSGPCVATRAEAHAVLRGEHEAELMDERYATAATAQA
jgi:MHS family proline/betaine transporter-like MFS transporter